MVTKWHVYFCIKLFKKHSEIFPQKRKYVKYNEKPWITQDIRDLIKLRNELHLSGPEEDFKRLRNTIV